MQGQIISTMKKKEERKWKENLFLALAAGFIFYNRDRILFYHLIKGTFPTTHYFSTVYIITYLFNDILIF